MKPEFKKFVQKKIPLFHYSDRLVFSEPEYVAKAIFAEIERRANDCDVNCCHEYGSGCTAKALSDLELEWFGK